MITAGLQYHRIRSYVFRERYLLLAGGYQAHQEGDLSSSAYCSSLSPLTHHPTINALFPIGAPYWCDRGFGMAIFPFAAGLAC
mmetsp:Transcript_53863/g.61878  ORF Transcript_53863/g.61878 Transcript_53863/m.61878 type:complete len:83 (+) Transcript_53863:69-317(+)